jgi:uncharacterized protein
MTIRSAFVMALATALLGASPASAQFSDSYNFLKAVKDRRSEGNKAIELMSKPGTVIIDTKDLSSGETALHIVTRERDLEWINFLLARGAKPDIRDAKGDTPLMVAARIRFPQAADALIRRRALVDLANSGGETPLIIAVQLRDPAMTRLLLNAGANPDKKDNLAGLSARDYAKRDNRAAAILKIIEEPRTKPAAVSGPKL